MDKLLHSRFFRFLVCFVLVCAILINCSPLRAEATEIGIGITGIGVLFWFMLIFGGMVIEPTQDVLNDLDRAGQAYIDDWIVQAADDAAAASEALRKAEADLSEWISDPSNFTGESSGDAGGEDTGDPDWGIHWDENGNIVLGSMLGGALARWFADSILADGVEVEKEVTADEGYVYAGMTSKKSSAPCASSFPPFWPIRTKVHGYSVWWILWKVLPALSVHPNCSRKLSQLVCTPINQFASTLNFSHTEIMTFVGVSCVLVSYLLTVTAALTTALGTIASDMTGVVGAIVPVAVPVLGGILVVTLGIKAFKKFTK